jgi:periplasmic protein TonB
MEPQEKLTAYELLISRLRSLQPLIDAHQFEEALSFVKEAKSVDSKNIYIIAIEKQIVKMMDSALAAENREEIIKSFPAMIERAIADTQRRQAAAKPVEIPPEKKEKEAALEKLKSQYFQRADDYVEKGEYQRALEEIRRIYIVEPGSIVAKEYEQKIEQLIVVQTKGEAKKEQEARDEERAVASSQSIESNQPSTTTWEPEEVSKTPVIIGIAAVIVLAIIGWFIFKPNPNSEQEQQAVEKPAITEWTAPVEERKDPLAEQKAVAPDDKAALQTMAKMTADAKAAEAKAAEEAAKAAAAKQRAAAKQQPVTPPASSKPAVTTQKPAVQQPQQQQTTVPPSPAAQQPQQQKTEAAAAPPPKPFVAIETHAEVLKRAPAIYPEIAYRMKLEGRVTVEILVDAQGKAVQAKVVRSSSEVFNDAAVEAAMKSVFKPAMMSTGPVSEKVYIPYNFSLPR